MPPAPRSTADRRPGAPRALARARRAMAALVALVVVLGGATTAAADVRVDATDVTPDGFTRVAVAVSGGCEGGATTGLQVQAPEGATGIAPEEVDGFTAAVEGATVTWDGGSVPATATLEVAFSARLAQPDGTRVPLPTIQACEEGEVAWTGEPEGDGPAPTLTVPVGGGAQAPTGAVDAGDAVDEDRPAAAAVAAAPDDESALGGGAVGFMVFAAVMVALAGGATYLVWRSRRAGSG